MTNETPFFDNKFDGVEITSQRFYNFCYTSRTRLTLGNTEGIYTPLLAIINPALTAFGNELNTIDTSLNQQKGSTVDTDIVLANFKKVMSDNERLIAKKLGGDTTAAYQEFYPHKKSEYSNASKVDMPVLTTRVFDAAELYTTQLGTELVTELQSFQLLWDGAHDTQTENKSKVATGRSNRSVERLALENAMMQALGAVLYNCTGDVVKCKSFFDFSLLYPVTRQFTFHIKISKDSVGNLEHVLKVDVSFDVTAVGANVRLFYSDEEDKFQFSMQEALDKIKKTMQNNDFGGDLATRKYIVIQNLSSDNDVVVTIVFKRK